MIKIGTSGFSFPDWKGPVYPASIRERDMLPFYEKELGFNVLELNFTYYALPSQKSLEGMAQKTSEGFEFVVKAFKGMTHDLWDKETGRRLDPRETFKKFKYGLVPLIEENKLACVLAQFPYAFFPNRENSNYLQEFKGEMEDIPLVLEFRNKAWFRDETFQFLEKKEIGFGSQIRSYVLHPYRLIKDHRTKFEMGDTDRVLDGDLDPFLKAYLLSRRTAMSR